MAITLCGDLRGDFFMAGKGGKRWLFREDKQKEDYGMFFSGLDLAQPAKQGKQIIPQQTKIINRLLR
jgi:hypothetical protein